MTIRRHSSITTGPSEPRPPLDRSARRYFVYALNDASETPVYIGRSCNVAARLRAHCWDVTRRHAPDAFKARWLCDVRSVSMVGPFTWDEAVREELKQIKTKHPRGNRTGRVARP